MFRPFVVIAGLGIAMLSGLRALGQKYRLGIYVHSHQLRGIYTEIPKCHDYVDRVVFFLQYAITGHCHPSRRSADLPAPAVGAL